MNKQKTSIAAVALIAAIAMTTIGLTGVSTNSLMVSAVSQESISPMGIMGHVEYTKLDSAGNIIAYSQADNTVVDDGKDCAARYLFGTAAGTSECGSAVTTFGGFHYIGIGNSSKTVPASYANEGALHWEGANRCAHISTGAGDTGGEMARKNVTATLLTPAEADSTSGTIVELDLSSNPFTFNTSNETTVFQSALFNADPGVLSVGTGSCDSTAIGVNGTEWNMFSIQELNSPGGIDVSDGDSLSVKWTITIGG